MKASATVACILALLIVPATAAAHPLTAPSPPPNDNRASATAVGGLPATLSGTTVAATDDPNDPRSDCGRAHDTVWFRLSGAEPGRIVLRLSAFGELDAVASVYRAVRSRLTPVGCTATDENGRGALSFTSSGGDYLVMVGRERTSDDGKFRLTMFRQEPSSRPPGRALPRQGIASWVEPIADFDDAWSLRMKGPSSTASTSRRPAGAASRSRSSGRKRVPSRAPRRFACSPAAATSCTRRAPAAAGATRCS